MFRTLIASLVAFAQVANAAPDAGAIKPVRKPLQFVLLAFDGSEGIDRWQDTRQFAKDNHIKFTYFVSGVLFLGRTAPASQTKSGDMIMAYKGPHHAAGASDIGFSGFATGNTATNQPIILQRVEQMNLAVAEGHELGSHANGHFDGSQWSRADWDQEFADFNALLFDPIYKGSIGGSRIDRTSFIKPSTFSYKVKDFVGFRTPYLSQNKDLFPVLAKYGYRYDTSKTSEPNYWPEKQNGIWNFPLAEIEIVGAEPWELQKTLSMDYNFYVSQQRTKAQRAAPVNDPPNQQMFYKQMLNSYRKYFKSNYDGNRAPIHIGHHFSNWNGAAYWNALKDFSKEVCHLQDVRCITYRELADFMDTLTPAELLAYRHGRFTNEPPALGRFTQVKTKKGDRNVAQFKQVWVDELAQAQLKLGGKAGDLQQEAAKKFLQRWQGFKVDMASRLTRTNLEWLSKFQPPAQLRIQGFDKTYQQLVDEELAFGPSPAHACEGGGECEGM